MSQMILSDVSAYKDMRSDEHIQSIPYTDSTNEKSKPTEENDHLSQLLYERSFSKNTLCEVKNGENYYSEQMKSNLMSTQEQEDAYRSTDKTQNWQYPHSGLYIMDKNASCSYEENADYSMCAENKKNYGIVSQEMFLSSSFNDENFTNDEYPFGVDDTAPMHNVNYICTNNAGWQSTLNGQEVPSFTQNEENCTKITEEGERVRSSSEPPCLERETINQKEPPNHRVRRKTAQKCLELIEQDRLNRKMSER